jgi:molybdopterin-synthase adenylyltransferase
MIRMSNELTSSLSDRYSRQMLFAPIGENGQAAIRKAKVAIVGLGALGTVLSNHMTRAGIGFLRLIDRDFVEASNLQRQMLYDEADAAAATPKAIAAAERLRRINSEVELEAHVADFNSTNAEALLDGMDLVLDGTDNFSVRFLINDACVKAGVPWIYGGAVSSRGVTMNIIPGSTPCLRCLYARPPAPGTMDTCDTAGVIAPIIDIVASYQAAEAMKLIVGDHARLRKGMTQFDLWHNHFTDIDLSGARKSDCPCCGLRQFDFLDAIYEGETVQTLCGRNTVQIAPVRQIRLELPLLAERLKAHGTVEANPFLLRFQATDSIKLVLFPDGRTLVQGTDDPVEAKKYVNQFLGM